MSISLKRTVVIGTSCSGKTTFARELAQLLGSRHVELDPLHWGGNWTARPQEEFRRLVSQQISGDDWVVDGNYRTVREIIWPRATALVWLDYSLPIVFCRALRRTLGRVVRREVLYSGNRESLRMALMSRESILLWVLRSHRPLRREYSALARSDECGGPKIIRLSSPGKALEFLAEQRRIRSAADRSGARNPSVRAVV